MGDKLDGQTGGRSQESFFPESRAPAAGATQAPQQSDPNHSCHNDT